MPRQDRLRLCHPGPLHDLRRAEHRRRRGCRTIGRQQSEIGSEQPAQRGAAVGNPGAVLDHLVEQGARADRIAVADHERGLARLDRQQGGAVGEIGADGRDRAVVGGGRSGAIATGLVDQCALDRNFALEPAGRADASVADLGDGRSGLVERGGGLGQLARAAKRHAADLGCLPVEDGGALAHGQPAADRRQFLRARALAIDQQRQRHFDQALAQAVAAVGHRADRPLQFGQSAVRIALVDGIDRAVVADQALRYAVALRCDHFGARQQAAGGGGIAKVRLLQPLVGDRFGKRLRIVAIAPGKRLEKFGRFGVAAAVAARIGFAARIDRVERPGLDPRERGGVADFGCGDLDHALLRLVEHHRRQREPERRIIAREPFADVMVLAAVDSVAKIVEPRRGVVTAQRFDLAQALDRCRDRLTA